MKIIITSPSLNVNTNVSGVSSVANFIIKLNPKHRYIHFEVGKKDVDARGLKMIFRILIMYIKWFALMFTRFDLIHFNFPVDRRSVIRDVPMVMLAKLFGKRMVIHLHGGELLLSNNVPGWLDFLVKIALSGRRPIIFLSSEEKHFITQKYNCYCSETLPNAIDLTDAEKFERKYSADEIPTLLFIGRITGEKGIAQIYDALKILKEQGLNFKYVMAGKGPAQAEFHKKFTDLLGDKYEFKGIVSGDSKTETFKQCNIFLLPSYYEGLPIALLEAMSFGLVPVTTDVGAMKTVVVTGTTGIIVGVKSTEDIVAAVNKLAADKLYMKKISKNAKKLVRVAYNPHKYIEMLNNVYQYE
ncbi:glycosyltransferase family 4 protein [Mucilaginibacter sp. HMF5004]|uniref:glycosyltransferase family 4 protein n=1 Tax=Mucilaginibacter rivuli TaxID=2857527 RepID=UPI001C5F9943|nr:glycosyltransferase family 4 protein [Mucilaginibacter rivuli]MBW4890064.1 glycosyltransferase family 4 protein [Mucilaginibacter rivuli]